MKSLLNVPFSLLSLLPSFLSYPGNDKPSFSEYIINDKNIKKKKKEYLPGRGMVYTHFKSLGKHVLSGWRKVNRGWLLPKSL